MRRTPPPLLILPLTLLPFTAHAALQKVNLGIYGGQVMDVAAYPDGTTSGVLIGVDSIKGVYQWDATRSRWSSVTYPTIVGPAMQLEANLASGYGDDLYTIIHTVGGPAEVFASDSGGAPGSWYPLATAISEPTVLLGHASGLYVGTRDGKVYRSGGGTADPFTVVYSDPSGREVTSVSAVSASDGYVMLRDSAMTPYLERVNFGGGAGSAITLPTATASGSTTVEVQVVGADPSDPSGNTLYIAGSSANPQAYRSTDGGASWPDAWDRDAGVGSPNYFEGYPQYVKFNAGRVFISGSVLDAGAATWERAPNLSTRIGVATITTHANDGALEVDPLDPTTVYAATDWAIGEFNHTAGSGWGAATEMGNAYGIGGVILNDFSFYEYSATSKELWIAAKSGLGRARHFDPSDPTSTSRPSDWIFPIFPPDSGEPFTAVAIDPNDPDHVLAGNNGGKIYLNTAATTVSGAVGGWSRTFEAEAHTASFGANRPDHSDITRIAFVPTSCPRVYLAGRNWESGRDGGVFYSDDGGTTWNEDTRNSDGTPLAMPVNALWVSDDTVWAGVGDERGSARGLRWRLSVCGSSSFWQPTTGANLDNEVVSAIDGVRLGGDYTVYVATHGGAYKGEKPSGSSSWSWSDVTPAGASGAPFSAVTVNTADADNAFLAVDNCIFETTDGGATWATFGSSCSTTHEAVRVLRFDDLLVGTAEGAYAYAPLPLTGAEPSEQVQVAIDASPAQPSAQTPLDIMAHFPAVADAHIYYVVVYNGAVLMRQGADRWVPWDQTLAGLEPADGPLNLGDDDGWGIAEGLQGLPGTFLFYAAYRDADGVLHYSAEPLRLELAP
ncbi:hypothetical protein [Endothiovibrio diazotrophicus]